jgi:hypothetical protein
MHSCDQPTSAILNLTFRYITWFSRFIRCNAGHRAGQARHGQGKAILLGRRAKQKIQPCQAFSHFRECGLARKVFGMCLSFPCIMASISLNFSFNGMSLQCRPQKAIHRVMPVSLILDTGHVPWHHQMCPLWLVSLLTCTAFL